MPLKQRLKKGWDDMIIYLSTNLPIWKAAFKKHSKPARDYCSKQWKLFIASLKKKSPKKSHSGNKLISFLPKFVFWIATPLIVLFLVNQKYGDISFPQWFSFFGTIWFWICVAVVLLVTLGIIFRKRIKLAFPTWKGPNIWTILGVIVLVVAIKFLCEWVGYRWHVQQAKEEIRLHQPYGSIQLQNTPAVPSPSSSEYISYGTIALKDGKSKKWNRVNINDVFYPASDRTFTLRFMKCSDTSCHWDIKTTHHTDGKVDVLRLDDKDNWTPGLYTVTLLDTDADVVYSTHY